MKVMLAPDSFKGSLGAEEAARAMKAGIAAVDRGIGVDVCPIADGGEGFVTAMVAATGGTLHTVTASGPLGEPVDAAWAMLPDRTAVIETAAASGLVLMPEARRDATRASTHGTGQLVAAALDAGCSRILLGLGGSATNDGGTGMAQALGVRFHDAANQPITRPMCGALLKDIASIDTSRVHPRLRDITFTVACDVTNPLTGPRGASAVYGPQKGASPDDVAMLDAGLRHLAKVLRERLGCDVEAVAGAGAAGGLGAGAMAFCGATLRSGIDLVLDAVGFEDRVASCDLCLTGEGRLDGQSLSGKAVLGVAQAAARRGVPTVALVGSAADDAEVCLRHGLADYRVIGRGHTTAYAMQHAAALLERQTEALVRERRG